LTVHLISSGSCTITAHQSGGGNYLPAADVSQSFNITDAFVISNFTTLVPVGVGGVPTAIPSTLTLTTANGNETSAAWYPTEQTVGNGFTTQFQFSIPQYGGADGFAFVLLGGGSGTSTLGTTGMGGYLGYQGIPNSIAIEFDTYQNGWDPNANHIAIQSNGTSANSAAHNNSDPSNPPPSLAVVTALDPSVTNLSGGATYTVKITYDGNSTLNVYLNGTLVATASVNLNTWLTLDAGGKAVLGFTAATGADSEVTHISSWSFTSN
jgi:hypothetical protein